LFYFLTLVIKMSPLLCVCVFGGGSSNYYTRERDARAKESFDLDNIQFITQLHLFKFFSFSLLDSFFFLRLKIV